jgi:4-amino-4-deoxy-L-arabinose transferase-like glycosyltransferase
MHAVPRRFGARLACVAGIALFVRLVVVLTDWRRTQAPGVTDEGGYHLGANLFAQGRGLINPFTWEFFGRSEPTAGHPPLYTMVLSIPSALGFDTPLSHRIFTLLIGVALVVAIGFLAREIAGDRAGLVAALVAAFYPHLWISDTAIMPEALFCLLVVCALLVGYRLWRAPTMRLALALGALVGLAALTRSEGLIFFPLVALPFVVVAKGIDRRTKVKLAAAGAAVGLVLVGAWVVRNLVTFDETTTMASGSGHMLASANCDLTYSDAYLGYWHPSCGLKNWPDGDESVVDLAAREKATGYIGDHLDRVPVVAAARVGRLWDVYRPFQNVSLNALFERRGLWPSRLALVAYVLLIIPAVYGLVTMRRRGVPISPIIGLIIAVTVIAAVSIGLTRYRAPIDALLPVLAAVGLEGWLARPRRSPPSDADAEDAAGSDDAGSDDAGSDDAGVAVGGASRLRASRTFWICFGIVVLGSLAWRVGYVVAVRETVDHPSFEDFYLNGDQYYYREQALALAHEGLWYIDPAPYRGNGFVLPSAGHPPAYTSYLAATAVLGFDSITEQRLASALLGAITVALVGLVGWRLAGERAGILVAILAAAYPHLWINNAMVMGENATQLAVALWLLAVYAYWRNPRLRNGVLMGAATGLAALTRSELALLFLVVVLPVVLLKMRGSERRVKIKQAVAALGVGALVIAPWSIFNTVRFGQPVTITTGQGAVLSVGACDEAFYGTYIGFAANCFQGTWPEDANEIERDVKPREQAIEYYEDHLDRIPIVVAARVGRVWNVFRIGQSTFLDWAYEGRGRGASWAGLIFYYCMIPFGIAGLVAMRRRKQTILPIIGLVVCVTAAVAPTFGGIRYRAPFEVGLVLVAGLGLDATWRHVAQRRADRALAEAP